MVTEIDRIDSTFFEAIRVLVMRLSNEGGGEKKKISINILPDY